MQKANGTQIGQSLNDFVHEWGIPEHLTFDGAMAQIGRNTDFIKLTVGRKFDIVGAKYRKLSAKLLTK